MFFSNRGIRPDDHKRETRHKKIEPLPPPDFVVLPIGGNEPLEPLVELGETVYLGEMIADCPVWEGVPVHASVSGYVDAIETRPHPSGVPQLSIVLKSDGRDKPSPGLRPHGSVETLDPNRLARIVRDAGIVGLGGAGMPTHLKIEAARGKCDTLILNGCESEPYSTSDHRIMLEAPEEIIGGLKLLMKALAPARAFIAVESNKRDAAESLRRTLPGATDIRVRVLPSRYPQGAEVNLVRAVTGRKIPAGGNAVNVGCAVFNIDTAAAIHRAVTTGTPLVRRIVTVGGSDIGAPQNLMVRIGTPMGTVFDGAGGFREMPQKILAQGPMMGICQYDLAAPIIKTTGTLLAFSEPRTLEPGACIRCAKCVRVCPQQLLPCSLALYAADPQELQKLRLNECIECGSCAYVCPARRPLVQIFRTAKTTNNEQARTC